MYDYTPPVSHYEYTTKAPNNVESEKRFKQTALYSMKQLQGWCSEYKASTLMDIIWLMRPKTVVEIGVFGGKSLVPMAYALKALGNGSVIYGIDPWSPQASAEGQLDPANKSYWENLDHGAILRDLQSKITLFNLDAQIRLIQATSADAPPIQEIDIIHIDGNHSDDASYYDICKWGPMVRKGGMVIFDDITWSTIDRAITWLDDNYVRLLQIDDVENSWGIWIKP